MKKLFTTRMYVYVYSHSTFKFLKNMNMYIHIVY